MKRSASPRRAWGLATALLAIVACRPAAARAEGGAPPSPARPWSDTPRSGGSAADCLARARALHTRLRGTRGEEREAARRAAVEAYREVRRRFPDARPEAAEAAFRAGELLRAGGETRGALVEFRFAREHGRPSDFAARAGLEIGHLHRRAHRLLDALDAYEAVGADVTARRERRDAAWLWAGRVQARLGRTRDAVRAWRRVAEGEGDPLDRVRAFDAWALALLGEGDLEGAAGVLARCRNSLRERSLEESEHGARLRAALASMRAIEALEGAIEARRRVDRRVRESRGHVRGLEAGPPPQASSLLRARHLRFRGMGTRPIPRFPPPSLSGM